MKKIKILMPPGIGDSLWSITKIPDMRKKLNPESVEVIVQNTDFNRSEDFLLHFNFIDSVSYQDFDIHPSVQYFQNLYGFYTPIDKEGRYIYCESTENFMGDPNSWLLIANGHLERGNRLETWFPEFETEMNIAKHWVWKDKELEWAEQFHEGPLNNSPFIIFYMGPLNGNTTSGFNRNELWSPQDWYKIGEDLPINHKIVIVGHQRDWQYANLFIGSLSKSGGKDYINLCGKTKIGECFALIKRSQFFLSYPCGIGIFSAYLSHPTAIFFRPDGNSISSEYYISFHKALSYCWCPKPFINSTYFPLFYTQDTANSVTEIIKKFL